MEARINLIWMAKKYMEKMQNLCKGLCEINNNNYCDQPKSKH